MQETSGTVPRFLLLAFMQANDALAKCMAGQNVEAYKAMSAAEQQGVCRAEADAVRTILRDDKVSFRNLLSERLAFAKAAQQQ